MKPALRSMLVCVSFRLRTSLKVSEPYSACAKKKAQNNQQLRIFFVSSVVQVAHVTKAMLRLRQKGTKMISTCRFLISSRSGCAHR